MHFTIDNLAKCLGALFVAATVMFWVASCETSPKVSSGTTPPTMPNIDTPRTNIHQSAGEVGTVATSIGTRAVNIDKHATDIETKTPPAERPAIQPSLTGIRLETDGLRDDKATLTAVQKKLEDTEGQLKAEQLNVSKWIDYANNADASNAKLKDEVSKLQDENAATFKRMMAYLAVICVAGIGICTVIAFFGRSKTAIMVAVGFGITLAVSTAVTLYLKAIALVTIIVLGVAFAVVIGYMGWQAFKSKKAEEELVHTGELAKQYLAPEAREHIFGYGAEPGKVAQIQSKSTQERVKQIRQYNEKQNVKLAPSLPEYWRPPNSVPRPTDPYLRPTVDAYNYPSGGHRETII